MSIEKSLERIADALEKLVSTKTSHKPGAAEKKVDEPKKDEPKKDEPKKKADKPKKDELKKDEPQESISVEELQEALVAEFHRLQGREKIDEVFEEYGIKGIKELDADKRLELLEKVKAK